MTTTGDRPRQFSPQDIKRFRANLKDEVDGAALYYALANAESNPQLSEVYRRLAKSEERHQALWRLMLQEAGADVPDYRPSARSRFLGWVAARFGPATVTPIVTRMEHDAYTMYDDQPEAVAEGLPREERSHARLFREIGRGRRVGEVDIAQIEGRHRLASGNALRAAVLGANDGLVSNLLLVMGVAGATPGRDVVILTGFAGLLAGSVSMALGEWVSVRSSTEAFERQVAIERDELTHMPEEEQEELALIYQAKGLSRQEAEATAARIIQDKERALDTLVQEELGMSMDDSGSAWVAAFTSFATFGVGAIIPLLPWLIVSGYTAVVASVIASGLGLFSIGAATTLFTGRSIAFAGARMLLIGLIAALVTFGIGSAIGVGADI